MSTLLLVLAALTLLAYLATFIEMIIGGRQIARLEDIPPLAGDQLPSISIIIPARNEARNIRAGLQSMLQLDYPRLELIAINDRSTDDTGEILDRFAAESPQLRVVHIRELPPGWLGKNHAMHFGAAKASGDLILFTDADIILDRSVLRRAVNQMLRKKLDHLAIGPRIIMNSLGMQAFIGTFSIFFMQYSKPWKAPDPKSKKHIGIGAFNLVRASVYRAIGGHQPLAMRPDDDMKLGKLIKSKGYRQEFVDGGPMVAVEWYSSLREVVDGLMKNAYSGLGYSTAAVAASVVAQLLGNIWPFVAIFVTGGVVQVLNGLIVLTICTLYCASALHVGVRPWLCVAFPLTTALFIYILVKATWITLANDGIRWRGTHYSLAELRANKI